MKKLALSFALFAASSIINCFICCSYASSEVEPQIGSSPIKEEVFSTNNLLPSSLWTIEAAMNMHSIAAILREMSI